MKPGSGGKREPDENAGLLPQGTDVRPPSYFNDISSGRNENTLLLDGREEFETMVYGAKVITAPVTAEPCLYWWLEIAHEAEEANYHLLTQKSENTLYVRVGDVFVKAGHPKRGGKPDFEKTYRAGEEPENSPRPAHSYPDVTYRLWVIKPEKTYNVRVEKFGSALPPRGPDDRPRYETHYHFSFSRRDSC